MEFFLNRYRNLSVLLVAILAQLILLAYQVKSSQDVRLIRVWAMTAVTPLARLIETARSGTSGFLHDYFVLLDVRDENKRIREELERSEIENQYLRAELSTAERAKSLAIFQATSDSTTVGARIIMNTTDTGGKTVVVDRGASSGIQKNMAVITAEGIVGKVIDVYPWTSNVLLITDASFGAGVVSVKNQVLGELRVHTGAVMVDNVQNEEKVEEGEWFVTSGQDLIFPRGLKVGKVTVVRTGKSNKEIYLTPSGIQNLTEVLIVTDSVQHGTMPEGPAQSQAVHLLKPPPGEESVPAADPSTSGAAATGAPSPSMVTDADRVTQRIKPLGPFGASNRPAPNFNAPPRPSNPTGAKPPSGSSPGLPGGLPGGLPANP